MALLAGAMCGVRNDSCSRIHKYARTSHGMASESLSRGVDLFLAQEFCFIKQEHGPPRGSKQAKTDALLTTVVGPLRRVLSKCSVAHMYLHHGTCSPFQRWQTALVSSGIQRLVNVAFLGRNFTDTVRKAFGHVQEPERTKRNCVASQFYIASHGHSQGGAAPQQIPRWINTRSFVTLTPESVLHSDIPESFHGCVRFEQPSP